MSKEHPILFNGEMVRAILDGRKTQTRRVVKRQTCGEPYANILRADMRSCTGFAWSHGWVERCPYGQPGDRLVLLCTWAATKEYDKVKPSLLPRDVRIWTLFDGEQKPDWCGRRRPGRFMPKWMRPRMPRAEVTDVRVQRVREITLDECAAEGSPPTHADDQVWDSTGTFRDLWDSINAKRGYSWESNPWVWVVTFNWINL